MKKYSVILKVSIGFEEYVEAEDEDAAALIAEGEILKKLYPRYDVVSYQVFDITEV